MGEKAQAAHIRAIRDFAAFLGHSPDTATPDELRAYQLHMTDTGVTPSTFNVRIVALRFFFGVTCGREEMKRFMQFRTEGQELGGRGSETEKAAVINALKSLMQIPDWPVNLIVSGTPELNYLLMQDPQLSRRYFVVRFLPVTEFDACDEVRGLMEGYTALADITLAPDLADVEFVPRLIHAGREQFGIVVEMIIGAITRALGDGNAAVSLKDFARFYAERSGDVSARNPFLVPDFRSIPTGRTPLEPEPPTSPKRGRKTPRGGR